jgi:CRISPR-associated endonuclease/helicase Cas3
VRSPSAETGRTQFLAHSPNDHGAGVSEALRDHLQTVADRASCFAGAFGAAEQAHAAGLLHDLGKYAEQFLRRLSDPREPGRDHWTAGAALLAATARDLGIIPAIAISGHHAGLRRHAYQAVDLCRELRDALTARPDEYTETNLRLLGERFIDDGFAVPRLSRGLTISTRGGQLAADMLDVRMFFSALVDADFLETEAHFNGDAEVPRRPRPGGPALDLGKAIAALDKHVELTRSRWRDSPMSADRDALYAQCVAAAVQSPGLFSLSAPTGAGKTLAMLAFALHHARAYGLRRIVLVMPFLNIIEQTAAAYRQIFSPERGFDPNTILEHHSLADREAESSNSNETDREESLRRLLAENWDSPIILTTNVQLLESLMADRPARCRKLHSLARSVILFDEVQTMPLPLAVATLATLSRLADGNGPFHSTVVFATATQPAFDVLHDRVRREFAMAGWRPREIVGDPGPLYVAAARRVSVSWRHAEPIELDDLATELESHDRVLCIVNLKRHAMRLATTLRERRAKGLLHLSTNMCPAHRAEVLKQVYRRLSSGRKVRLVATQCVEAGVDIDFPVVYRALGPLEAIAQAAGRCNRHGLGSPGQFVVFQPRDERGLYPPGYRDPVGATETFLAGLAGQADLDAIEILNDPERLRAYFRQFYGLSGRTSSEGDDERPLLEAIRAGDFNEVAKLYRLIKQDTVNVLVPYDPAVFSRLRREILETQPLTSEFIRGWCRRATHHAVSLFRPSDGAPIVPHLEPIQFSRRHRVEVPDAEWFISLPGITYDPLMGVSERADDLWIA